MDFLDKNRKVVLITGDENKNYEQAIFILRPGAASEEIDLIREAERIISRVQKNPYSDSSRNATPKPKEVPPPLLTKNPPLEPKGGVATNSKKMGRRPKTRIDFGLNIALVMTGLAIMALFFLNMI